MVSCWIRQVASQSTVQNHNNVYFATHLRQTYKWKIRGPLNPVGKGIRAATWPTVHRDIMLCYPFQISDFNLQLPSTEEHCSNYDVKAELGVRASLASTGKYLLFCHFLPPAPFPWWWRWSCWSGSSPSPCMLPPPSSHTSRGVIGDVITLFTLTSWK